MGVFAGLPLRATVLAGGGDGGGCRYLSGMGLLDSGGA